MESNGRAYAVVYGTGNRAGVTYAHYLAEKGFNLILIERDLQPLNDLENQLREKFANMSAASAKGKRVWQAPTVYKIVMNKFD
jgi:short-subunit dehydrogenase